MFSVIVLSRIHGAPQTRLLDCYSGGLSSPTRVIETRPRRFAVCYPLVTRTTPVRIIVSTPCERWLIPTTVKGPTQWTLKDYCSLGLVPSVCGSIAGPLTDGYLLWLDVIIVEFGEKEREKLIIIIALNRNHLLAVTTDREFSNS
jgi:hypothetical protein